MNRYRGNTGRYSKYTETVKKTAPDVRRGHNAKTSCIRQNENKDQASGDMWILAMFFVLYLESRDTDFLVILAVLAFYMFDMGESVKRLLTA